MTKDKEIASPQASKHDVAHAKGIHTKIASVAKEYRENKFLLCKLIWEMNLCKGWELLGYASDSAYIADQFKKEQINFGMWREHCRIYGQFLAQLNSGANADHRKTGEEVVKVMTAVAHQVGDNASYVGEIARHNIAGDNERETERNIKVIGDLYKNSDNIKDFKAKVAGKFSKLNKAHAEANSKPGKNTEGLVNLMFKVDALQYQNITTAFEALSVSIGARKPFAEMTNEERGRILGLIALEVSNNKEAVIVMDERGKRAAATRHIKEALFLWTGVEPGAAKMKAMSDVVEHAIEAGDEAEEAAEA